jgi:signal transduction histidine kinase
MLPKNLFFRITAPIILVSLLLLGLCVVTGAVLWQWQSGTAETLQENVGSRRVAYELEVTLRHLAQLLRTGSLRVEVLHDDIGSLLREAQAYADKSEEIQLVGQLKDSFGRYFRHWEMSRRAKGDARQQAATAALAVLDRETIPVCRRLRDYNTSQIEISEAAYRQTVFWVGVGLIGICSLGATAGLLMGYGVARGLRQTIYHLSVRVQDAANKLGQDVASLSVAEDGDLNQLHEQLKYVVREIEQVVARLQQREREILRADQLAAVGQLAAGVAHELRNPLTSVKMLVQVLREELEARGLPAEDLTVIELEIRRMERTLQTFLDFARPPKPELRPLDVSEAVRRTLALVGGRARKQNVTLDFSPPEPPVFIQADPEQMQQLLVNLALNALDAMPRGGTLEVCVDRSSPTQVVLRVRDTGSGIAPELMARLFQPFVSGKETGLGLGLVTSKRIAESHGGTIHADSLPGGGACFVVRLPALEKVVVHSP